MTNSPAAPVPGTEFLFEARVKLSAPLDVGPGPEGHRVIFFVKGGTVKGPRLNGLVIPDSGADWVRRRADGSSYLDVRFCWKSNDGAIIYVCWHGRFTPGERGDAQAAGPSPSHGGAIKVIVVEIVEPHKPLKGPRAGRAIGESRRRSAG